MHVALTGVSGFIGAVVARRLHAAGHTLTALVRPTSRRDRVESLVDRFVVGEQADQLAWPDLLEGADCVIHNSADWSALQDADGFDRHLESNLLGSIRLIRAAVPRQFIFLSTIAVHHDMRPRWKGVVDEDHPLRPALLYGAYKASVEEHLWSAHFTDGMPTCAVRPCGVYGIDPSLRRSHGYDLIRKIRRGRDITKPGGGKFVHVDDVADVIVATVGNPDAAGKVYNVADCYARWADWAMMARELLGADVAIDDTSPTEPANVFSKDAVRSLGVELDRGHEGIRKHLVELIEAMDAE